MRRRDFLKTGFMGATAFAVSGLTLVVPRRSAAATVVDVDLVAEGDFRSMADGTSVYVWQFRDPAGSGPGALRSGLLVREGDTVNVTVENQLDRPINFVIPGVLPASPTISPGSHRTYSYTAPLAGSYMYYDGASGGIGRAMGLSGPMVVMPPNGWDALSSGGPAFDRQYTLVLSELDDRLNQAIYRRQPFEMSDYQPNYFFANGLSYPDTAHDGNTLVEMRVGEDVAIRFINTGMIVSPMHFHGYHVNVVSRNRVPETAVIEKDTVRVAVGECVDVMLPVNQPGTFPLHTHFVPGVTSNGVYLNPHGGALIVMQAS